jgi:hypothetical protein
MKTLGAVLIVSGLLLSLIGYGFYENIACHCPTQTDDHLGCYCKSMFENIGHLLVYVGFTVAGSGIFIFMKWWRKKIIFN